MPDETPQATDTEPVTAPEAYQPPPTVITLYDRNGREHHTAPTSPWAVKGLADGTLTEHQPAKDSGEQSSEEAPNGDSEPGSAGDDPESGNSDRSEGLGDGAPDPTPAGRRRGTGKA